MAQAAIGIVSGLLSIIKFGMDTFAEKPKAGSTYKVAVGLDGPSGLSNAGGNMPDVRVFNDFGKQVGKKLKNGKIHDGDVKSIHVSHQDQGVYTLFSARDDAICIAYVTTTWDDERGGNKYGVTGDFGSQCGGTWYYSHIYVDGSNQSYTPKCFWIDLNDDQPMSHFQVRWPSYNDAYFHGKDRNPNKFCDGVDFGISGAKMGKNPTINIHKKKTSRRDIADRHVRRNSHANHVRIFIENRDEDHDHSGKNGALVRRSTNSWVAHDLVITKRSNHPLRELCTSKTSFGPDIANTAEELFCDMDAKRLYHFCGGNSTATTACFDINTHTVENQQYEAGAQGANSTAPAVKSASKAVIKNQYSRIHSW